MIQLLVKKVDIGPGKSVTIISGEKKNTGRAVGNRGAALAC